MNSDDIVTKLPGFPVHEHDDCSEGDDEGEGAAEVASVSKMGWAYSDVGRELRLSSSSSSSQARFGTQRGGLA